MRVTIVATTTTHASRENGFIASPRFESRTSDMLVLFCPNATLKPRASQFDLFSKNLYATSGAQMRKLAKPGIKNVGMSF